MGLDRNRWVGLDKVGVILIIANFFGLLIACTASISAKSMVPRAL